MAVLWRSILTQPGPCVVRASHWRLLGASSWQGLPWAGVRQGAERTWGVTWRNQTVSVRGPGRGPHRRPQHWRGQQSQCWWGPAERGWREARGREGCTWVRGPRFGSQWKWGLGTSKRWQCCRQRVWVGVLDLLCDFCGGAWRAAGLVSRPALNRHCWEGWGQGRGQRHSLEVGDVLSWSPHLHSRRSL